MPDIISRQSLKKKALDRWENEGGRIIAEQAMLAKSGSSSERPREIKNNRTYTRIERPKSSKNEINQSAHDH